MNIVPDSAKSASPAGRLSLPEARSPAGPEGSGGCHCQNQNTKVSTSPIRGLSEKPMALVDRIKSPLNQCHLCSPNKPKDIQAVATLGPMSFDGETPEKIRELGAKQRLGFSKEARRMPTDLEIL